MKPAQEGIYYLVGRDISTLRASPKLESFLDKEYEVLLLTDPVDEVIMSQTHTYGETKFFNVGSGAGQATTEEEHKEGEKKLAELEADFVPLKESVMKFLGDVLSDARLSVRMTSSPACLVGESDALSLQMEQLMRAMGQDIPLVKRVLELNPEHPLVRRLMALARADDPRVKDCVTILYDQTLILDGGTIADPAKFARLLTGVMNMALETQET